MFNQVNLDELKWKKIERVEGLGQYSDEVILHTNDGVYKFLHHQDCCENVSLEDWEDDGITGGTILMAEEVINHDDPDNQHESCTWTFYKIETTTGSLWMRWLGSSNGYYSEGVSIERVDKKD